MPSVENKSTYQTVEAVNEEDKKNGQLSERCTLFKTGFQGSQTEITEMLWVLFEGLKKKMIVKQTGMVFKYNIHIAAKRVNSLDVIEFILINFHNS